MPLTGPEITASIIAAGGAVYPGSQDLPRIAQAIGASLPVWFQSPTNVLLNGVTAGFLGAGTATGKVTFVPTGQIIFALNSVGLNGPTAQGLGAAIEAGLVAILNVNASYIGVSVGVGTGTDITKVSISNPATLLPILLANLQAAGINGQQAAQLASGLSTGIAALVQTGSGFGAVAGPPGVFPSGGTSISRVF